MRLLAQFWLVMSVAGLIVEGLFAGLHLLPAHRTGEVVMTRFRWNYTSILDVIAIVVFAALYWLYRNRSRLGGGGGYAIDPVCRMQVRTADAPASVVHEGTPVYFCSDRCRERFEAGV